MRTAFLKLLLAITVSAMVALAVMGTYVVAMQSQDNPIVAPASNAIQHLPSQAPRPVPGKRYVSPGVPNQDTPGPK